MLIKKISMLTLSILLLVTNLSLNPTAFAANSINLAISNTQSSNLTQVNESAIKNVINEVLSLSPDVLKTGKSKDYSNIVKESTLLELLNKQSKFNAEWFKKLGFKIDEYNSNVTITNLTKTKTNTYVVDVLYDLEYNLLGTELLSKSKGDKYRFEVKYSDGKYYITKKLDLHEDTNQQKIKKLLKIKDTKFVNYDNIINTQIKVLDDKLKNIDKYYEYFKKIDANHK